MFAEAWTFIRRHWGHALLLPPGAIFVTVLHEAAHALAAWIQGGTLLEFAWLPWASAGHWGYVRYEFPPGVAYSSFAISVAPYVMWLMMAGLAWLLSLRRQHWGFGMASAIFVWLYVVPLADIANAALPWMHGSDNDFFQAFGSPMNLDALLIDLSIIVAVLIGYGVQVRLYGERRLSKRCYTLLCALTGIGLLAATGMI